MKRRVNKVCAEALLIQKNVINEIKKYGNFENFSKDRRMKAQ